MKKKKVLITVLVTLFIIICSIGGYAYFQEKKRQELYDSITLELKESQVLEYGSDVDAKDFVVSVSGEIKTPTIDTKILGKQVITYQVTKEDMTKNFEYNVEIKDTKKPDIIFSQNKVTLNYGEKFEMKKYIKSVKDPVDGNLSYKDKVTEDDKGYYTYSGEVNTKKAGKYEVKVIAVDINGNKSEKIFNIQVNEKIEEENGQSKVGIPSQSTQKPISTAKNKVIVIDAGHQGQGMSAKEAIGPGSSTMKAKVSSGTTGVASKKKESQVNLDVALKLRSELQSRGYKVVMTRTSQNVKLSNQQRAKIGNDANAGAVIHLHCDGGPSSSTGAHTIAIKKSNPYCPGLYNASSSLANKVIKAYCRETGIRSRGVSYRNDLTGLNWSTVPSIYLEMGFLSNKGEDLKLTDANFQRKMVKGIADGIDDYF